MDTNKVTIKIKISQNDLTFGKTLQDLDPTCHQGKEGPEMIYLRSNYKVIFKWEYFSYGTKTICPMRTSGSSKVAIGWLYRRVLHMLIVNSKSPNPYTKTTNPTKKVNYLREETGSTDVN
jgi:hypothetical protein